MNISIKGTNLELTQTIRHYVEKKLGHIKRFLGNDQDSHVAVEVGKTTRHHQHGDIFRAEINVPFGGTIIRAVAETSDLYASIDQVQEEIMNEIISRKDKKQTLFRRGAKRIKDMLRGWKGN